MNMSMSMSTSTSIDRSMRHEYYHGRESVCMYLIIRTSMNINSNTNVNKNLNVSMNMNIYGSSMTGELIRASVEQLRLEMGTEGNFFNIDWQRVEAFATPCWLRSPF